MTDRQMYKNKKDTKLVRFYNFYSQGNIDINSADEQTKAKTIGKMYTNSWKKEGFDIVSSQFVFLILILSRTRVLIIKSILPEQRNDRGTESDNNRKIPSVQP